MEKNFVWRSLPVSVIFFFLLQYAFSQQTDSLLIPGQFSSFSVDNLGNVYTITKQDTLIKHTFDKTMQTYQYSNASLGDIAAFDVTNPMQVIVSHDELSTLVLLDVTLRETSRIYLPDLEIFSSPIAFAQINDGTTWIYDDLKAELIRINNRGELVNKTQSIIQQVNFAPVVASMQANNDYVVMHDKEQGFLIFDQFGEFMKQIRKPGIDRFQLRADRLLYRQGEQLISYPIESIGVKSILKLPSDYQQFRFVNDTFFFLKDSGVFSLTLTGH